MRLKIVIYVGLIVCAFVGDSSASGAAPPADSFVSTLQTALRTMDPQDWKRRQEIEKLLNENKAQAAIALTNALDTSDLQVQKTAADLLVRMSGLQDFVIQDKSLTTLIAILKASKNAEVKANLLRTLGHVGPRNDRIQATILESLRKDDEVAVRVAACEAVSELMRNEKVSDAAIATAVLCEVLKNDISPHVRSSVARSMSHSPTLAPLVVAALTSAVDDNYKDVRVSAFTGLAKFGEEARPAVPKIIKNYKDDSDLNSRYQALNALYAIDRKNPEVISIFMEALEEPRTSAMVLGYLSGLGADAAPAIPKLMTILTSAENRSIKIQAANILGSIGPAATSVLPRLKTLANESQGPLKNAVEGAMKRISDDSIENTSPSVR